MITDHFKVQPPCSRDCPDRSPTCHSECWKYEQYRKDLNRLKAEYYSSKKSEQLINGYEIERAKRLFKK